MNDLFLKRRSVRQFTDQEVTDDQIQEIVKAGMFAPSGMHKRPWDLIVVKDKERLKELSEVGPWKGFIADSSVSIVIVGNPAESEFWLQDVSIVAGYISLEVTNQGLGSCWGNILWKEKPEEEERAREILNIPEDRRVLCALAIGYPETELPEHTDSEYDESKIHKEIW